MLRPNAQHLELLLRGVDVWNAWRAQEPSIELNLGGANLGGAKLSSVNLSGAYLAEADLQGADLTGADLTKARLLEARLDGAILSEANLSGANLNMANIGGATLYKTRLVGASLVEANLVSAKLDGAILTGANLSAASLVHTELPDANLTGCRVYGITAWDLKLNEGTKQQNLVVTPEGEPAVTVDKIEVAQFVYLFLRNEKIRDVIDTVGKKGVLLLGRFTDGRIAVLERLRDELRQRGWAPIIFNFDRPETKTYTETVRLLAGLSYFVIADVTDQESVPLELQATVPEVMVPFFLIIERRGKPVAMLGDLWIQYRDRVFKPIRYPRLDWLVQELDERIIKRAEKRFAKLLARKAQEMNREHS